MKRYMCGEASSDILRPVQTVPHYREPQCNGRDVGTVRGRRPMGRGQHERSFSQNSGATGWGARSSTRWCRDSVGFGPPKQSDCPWDLNCVADSKLGGGGGACHWVYRFPGGSGGWRNQRYKTAQKTRQDREARHSMFQGKVSPHYETGRRGMKSR